MKRNAKSGARSSAKTSTGKRSSSSASKKGQSASRQPASQESIDSLHELVLEQMQDLYDAEKQLVKILPKFAKTASAPELQEAFNEHLDQTKEQVHRLEQAFQQLGEKPKGKRCAGMAGIVEEGVEALEKEGEDMVIDAGLIVAAQKVEHYEIASYGSIISHAHLLGEDQLADLLQQTLDEEKMTDEKLTTLAESSINIQAEQADSAEDEEEREAA